MDWILLSLLPPALWSFTNHFDKYLISKYIKGGGVGALMVFSSIIGILLLPFIYFIQPSVITNFKPEYLIISISGIFYLLATLPYFYALTRDDASIAVPLFQMVPVFSFVLGFIFLGETLTIKQFIGGLVVLIGAIFISVNFSSNKKPRIKKDVFLLMALSSFLFALNFIVFKYFAVQSDFLTTSFWEYIGFGLFALFILIFIKSYRREFLSILKENRATVLTLNGINEIVNIMAKIAFNFASLLVPVTLVWIVNGTQPFFVFIYGVLITVFFPKIAKEDISRKMIMQKLIAIAIMFVGGFIINL